jgi:hypothetical protein
MRRMNAHHDRLAASVARGAPAMVSATAVKMMTDTVGNHDATASPQHDVILAPLRRKRRVPSIAPSRRSRGRQVDLLGVRALTAGDGDDDPRVMELARRARMPDFIR